MWALLKLLPIGVQIGLALGAAALIGGSYYAWRSSIFDKGAAYEAAQQKERDDEAVSKARDARNRVRDCYGSGGVWNTTNGICVGR